MGTNRLIGIGLIAVALVLFYFGYQSSQSVGDQIHETFTGRFTDATTWLFIGGVAAIMAGGALILVRR